MTFAHNSTDEAVEIIIEQDGTTTINDEQSTDRNSREDYSNKEQGTCEHDCAARGKVSNTCGDNLHCPWKQFKHFQTHCVVRNLAGIQILGTTSLRKSMNNDIGS